MEKIVKFPRWGFWFMWIGSNLLASIIVYGGNIAQAIYELLGYGVGIRAPVGNALRVTGQEAERLDFLISFIVIIVSSMIYGAIMGVIQSAILKPYLGKSGWWWATTLGYAAANIIGFALSKNLDAGILVGISGLVLGLFQWFVIRKKISKAYIWIVIVTLAWALNYHVIYFILISIGLLEFQLIARDGLVVGGAMIWFLRQYYPNEGISSTVITEHSN